MLSLCANSLNCTLTICALFCAYITLHCLTKNQKSSVHTGQREHETVNMRKHHCSEGGEGS